MTSDPDASAPPNKDEERKLSGDALGLRSPFKKLQFTQANRLTAFLCYAGGQSYHWLWPFFYPVPVQKPGFDVYSSVVDGGPPVRPFPALCFAARLRVGGSLRWRLFLFLPTCPLTATELADEPLPADWTVEPDGSGNGNEGAATASTEERPDGHLQGLVPDLERLACRMTQTELQHCSAEQLVQVHHRLGHMMEQVVEELHTRFCQTQGKPWM